MPEEEPGNDTPRCREDRHLWLTLPTTEDQRRITGRSEYEICGKCNAIKEPA